LIIPSANGPELFENCIADFQLECFRELAPALHAVRDGVMPKDRRFWIERTKKASKDNDLAICSLWLTTFPVRPFLTQVGAADKKQAGIVKRRANDIVHYNPWLDDYIDLQIYTIKNKINGLASVEILSADIAGAHGETPDVLIINELSHVQKWEFVQNLLSNAAGVPRGLVLIATNAGYKGTKPELQRNNAIENKNWKTFIYSKPAPWINPSDLEDEEKRESSKSRFRRLWYGEWISGTGDAFDEMDIDRCFNKTTVPLENPEKGWIYIAGLDLGVKHDHSGLVVLGVHINERKLKIVRMKAWEPEKNLSGKSEIDLIDVEEECIKLWKTFKISWFGFDPFQAALMSQRLVKKGVPMREVSFASSTNLTAMAVS
ncbi:hypothetical protein LCGC14_2955570, partial [marine sediment metagenome]